MTASKPYDCMSIFSLDGGLVTISFLSAPAQLFVFEETTFQPGYFPVLIRKRKSSAIL